MPNCNDTALKQWSYGKCREFEESGIRDADRKSPAIRRSFLIIG
jgi:hypothetical protein